MDSEYHFPPFRLDERSGLIWQRDKPIALRPKAFALLRYLIKRAGRLVSRDELLSALWSDVVVSDAALAVCIHELRNALGDDPHNPRFIETAHGRGYRFVAAVNVLAVSGNGATPRDAAGLRVLNDAAVATGGSDLFVGRETEFAVLADAWRRALDGTRQVVFVTCEPGIGKTSLVDRFAVRLTPSDAAMIARGQCIELYGEGEAYLPLFEALTSMCRSEGGNDLLRILQRHAPTWLAQAPGLKEPVPHELERVEAGPVQGRMLREIADALELFSLDRPILFAARRPAPQRPLHG